MFTGLGRRTARGVKARYRYIKGWRRFWKTYFQYKRLASSQMRPRLRYLYPCIGDDIQLTPIDPVYYYQDAWAFEKIYRRKPGCHVDIGSHHKFVALLSKVVPVTLVDIRPFPFPLESLQFRQGSILALPFEDDSIPSVSSICVIEHIGLGRYGDPLDPHGTEKAAAELKRVVAPGGDLYISVPLADDNRVYFNAHRAFTEAYVTELFAPFALIERQFIHGDGTFSAQDTSGFRVGCYHWRKSDVSRNETPG